MIVISNFWHLGSHVFLTTQNQSLIYGSSSSFPIACSCLPSLDCSPMLMLIFPIHSCNHKSLLSFCTAATSLPLQTLKLWIFTSSMYNVEAQFPPCARHHPNPGLLTLPCFGPLPISWTRCARLPGGSRAFHYCWMQVVAAVVPNSVYRGFAGPIRQLLCCLCKSSES